MSNQNKAEFSGVIVTNGNLSLEERVTALEKQLTEIKVRIGEGMKYADDDVVVGTLTAPPVRCR